MLPNILPDILIDTHCHINTIVKKEFDKPLIPENYLSAQNIIDQAEKNNVKIILNVGTSLVESINCINLAKKFSSCYAAIGIHPNDLNTNWKKELKELEQYIKDPNNKIKAIGECGIDMHYPEYNLSRQKDAFKYQIDMALSNNLALIVHSRDAYQETLDCLSEFKDTELKGSIHCFSYDLDFAKEAINMGFVLGIGGTITYPKNTNLRDTVLAVKLDNIVLETDAPFLPPQIMRGKQNSPLHIKTIAEFIADLTQTNLLEVSKQTSLNAQKIFNF